MIEWNKSRSYTWNRYEFILDSEYSQHLYCEAKWETATIGREFSFRLWNVYSSDLGVA